MNSIYRLIAIVLCLSACSTTQSHTGLQTPEDQAQLTHPANTLIPTLTASSTRALAPSPTYTPIPTETPRPTPTQIPTEGIIKLPFALITYDNLDFNSLALESLLIQPGDLPEGYAGGQIYDAVPDYIDLQSGPCEVGIYQVIEKDSSYSGGVTFLLCSDHSPWFSIGYDMEGWGQTFVNWGDPKNLGNGVLTFLNPIHGQGQGMDYLTSQCSIWFHIRILGTLNPEYMKTYVNQLSERFDEPVWSLMSDLAVSTWYFTHILNSPCPG